MSTRLDPNAAWPHLPGTSSEAKPHALALAATLALGVVANGALAQSGAPTLEPVTIAGQAGGSTVPAAALRTPVPLERTAQSVVVVGRELIEEQGLTTLGQVLENVSSARGIDSRDLNNAVALIRGFEAGIVMDGVALPGKFSTPTAIDGLQTVTVLKGPGSGIYGGSQSAGATGFVGGLIALTSAAPEARAAYRVGGRLASYEGRSLAVDLNQPISASTGVRLVASASREGSETDHLTQKITHLEPSFAWRPSADQDLVLRLRSTRTEGRDYSGLPVNGTLIDTGYTIPRNRIVDAEGQPDSRNDLDLVSLNWRLQFTPGWTLAITAARVHSEVDQYGVFTFPFPYDPAATPSPLITAAGARLWERYVSHSLAPSLTGQFSTGPVRHTLVGGVDLDYTRDDGLLRFSATPFFGALGFLDLTNPTPLTWVDADGTTPPSQHNQYRSRALYLSDQLDLGPLGLSAGLRRTRIDIVDVNPEAFVDNRSSNQATTGRLGATYAITPQVSVFAGRAEGMKVPTYAILSSPAKPEESSQKEVGVRLTRLQGLTASLAWFDLTVDNALVADPAVPFTSKQAGRQRSRGIDLDLKWQMTRQWQHLLALGRADARIVEDSSAALVGKQRFSVPRTTARLATRYTFGEGSALPGLGLGLGLTHHSALPGSSTNTFYTPSATVFDAQAGVRVGPAQLALTVRNLTDKQYWEPARYFNGGQVTPAPRRNVGLQAQIAF